MKYTLSFGYILRVRENIAELLIDEGTTVTVDMYEEYLEFIHENFAKPYAVLLNSINQFSFSPAVNSKVGANNSLAAIATVTYSKPQRAMIDKYENVDEEFNLRKFCGFNLGRNQAIQWLDLELNKQNANV